MYLGHGKTSYNSIFKKIIPFNNGQKDINKHFSKEDSHKKMLNLIRHQEKANQNPNEISLHINYDVYTKKNSHQQVLAMIWRNWNPHTNYDVYTKKKRTYQQVLAKI